MTAVDIATMARHRVDRIKTLMVQQMMQPGPSRNERESSDRRSVYFIAATTSCMVKIGVSANPVSRFQSLSTMSPEPLELVRVIPGIGRRGEQELHRRLAGSRSHGEWFYPTAEVMAAALGDDQ